MDLTAYHQQLLNDIDDLTSDIQTIKNRIYDIYESDKPQLLLKDIPRDQNDYTGPQKQIDRCVNLRFQELAIYEMIMKIRTDRTRSVLSAIILVPNTSCYGLQFDLNLEKGTYSLVRCYLPYSLKALEEKEKAKELQMNDIKTYLDQVRMNIYAFSMRKEQLDEFKAVHHGEQICFEYSLNCTQASIRFTVTVEETKMKHCAILNCVYLLDHIIPSELSLEIRPKMSPNLEASLLRCFEYFKQNTFRNAYEESFVDTELFQFF